MARKHDIRHDEHDFQFTRRWFRNRNLPTFRDHVLPEFKGKPTTYLELGVFEGMSAVWMLQYVLQHPRSKAVGIDPHLMTTKLDGNHMESVRQRAIHNTRPWADKFTLVRGCSVEVLRRMCRKGYAGIGEGVVDICMIDGDHNAPAVLDDALHVFRLLRPGGWMLFDDYNNDRPKRNHVKEGVEMFLQTEEGGQTDPLWEDRYIYAVKKQE